MKKFIEKIKKLSLNEKILIVLLFVSLIMVISSWNRITTQVKKSVNFFSGETVCPQ